jgi:hypothetical protein
VSRDRAQLVGLSISLRSIAKASYARHCRNTNVVCNFILDGSKLQRVGNDLIQNDKESIVKQANANALLD